MSYNDHGALLSCYLKHRKKTGSLKTYFSEFLKDDLAKSQWGRSKVVDEIFYIGDLRKQRSLLSDYDLTKSVKGKVEDEVSENQTIMLLNDYISRLDFRKEKSHYYLKTLLTVFLHRGTRDSYHKLKLPEEYAKKVKSIYAGIIRARITLLKEVQDTVLMVLKGGLVGYKPMTKNPNYYIEKYMNSGVEITGDLLSTVTSEDDDLDIFDEGDPRKTIESMGLGIITARSERVANKSVFPSASKAQLKLIRSILVDYSKAWHRFDPVQLNILAPCLGYSTQSYNTYLTKLIPQLVELSNQSSYEDITLYLKEDE